MCTAPINILNRVMAIVLLCTIGLISTQSALADDTAGHSKDPLTVQYFPLIGLPQIDFEFRYVDNQLGYVYFYNGGKPIHINLFATNYFLDQYKNLTLHAPNNLDKIILRVASATKQGAEQNTANPFNRTYIFTRDEPNTFYKLDTFY